MTETERATLADAETRFILDYAANRPPPRPVPLYGPHIHFTELPAAAPGEPLAEEWNCFRNEVGRLLAEGHEGRWVLIVGDKTVGIWDEETEAREAAATYSHRPTLVRRILTREPTLRTPTFFYRCRASSFPSHREAS